MNLIHEEYTSWTVHDGSWTIWSMNREPFIENIVHRKSFMNIMNAFIDITWNFQVVFSEEFNRNYPNKGKEQFKHLGTIGAVHVKIERDFRKREHILTSRHLRLGPEIHGSNFIIPLEQGPISPIKKEVINSLKRVSFA